MPLHLCTTDRVLDDILEWGNLNMAVSIPKSRILIERVEMTKLKSRKFLKTSFIAALPILFCSVFSHEAKASTFETRWLSDNLNGVETTPIEVPEGNKITGIEVREQSGYGVVNLRLNYGDRFTSWTTENQNGRRKSVTDPTRGLTPVGVQISEQSGFGVIDIQIVYRTDDGELLAHNWATENPNGQRLLYEVCPANSQMYGLVGREQSGYGIVNVKVLCEDI